MARLAAGLGLWAVLLFPGEGVGQDIPRPPCAGPPSPAYPEPGGQPLVRVWSAGEPGADWAPPTCTGWRPLPSRVLVATAGRFVHRGTAEDFLERLGAVSALTTVRYWSVRDRRWLDLVTDASALDGSFAAECRIVR